MQPVNAQLSSITDHVGLPNELLQFIFNQVPRSSLAQLALVSRQWNAVASPILYRHIYIRTLVHWDRFVACCYGKTARINTKSGACPPPWLASSVTSLVLRPSPRLIPRSTGLRTQGLVVDRDVEDQGYMRIQRVDLDNTGLERLHTDIGDADENYTDMDTTIKEAEWLTKVTDSDMAKVITQCPQLVYLQVSGVTQIGDATMYALASAITSSDMADHGRGRGMKGLWLDLTRQISTVAWMTFVHAEQKRLALQMEASSSRHAIQNLHHLDLSYCGFVTDTCLTKSLPLWTQSLTHLRLCSLYNITDDTVLAIAKHCPHLRLLHLSRCFRITNHSIIQLAASPLASSLVYLSLAFLNQINEEGIKRLVYACEHLRVLDISGTGINPMFKQIIIQQWDKGREQKNWGKICYQEEPVLLL